MTQAELDRAVAHATGDSLPQVQRLGFQLADLFPDQLDDLASDYCLSEAPRAFEWLDRTGVTLEDYLAAVR